MTKLTQPVADRLATLLREAPHKIPWDGPDRAKAQGWCVSAASVIHAVVADPKHPYRTEARMQVASVDMDLDGAVSVLLGMLQHVQQDFEAGLLNLEARVSAQTFDDLLDHADAYLGQKRHEPAGVLAGVVFEDTVRKLCDKHGILQDGIPLENLLSELVKKSVMTPFERKEASTAAALRTSATHARWAEYGLVQVGPVIDFTRRLIREKLAS